MCEGRDRFGAPAAASDLLAPKARSLAAILAARDDVGCGLVATAQNGEVSWVMVDVEVDVGQQPKVDIRRVEPIALGFSLEDRGWPEVRALRPDFPRWLHHQFLVPANEPPALCLSEAPFEDVKRRWSSGGYVALLRAWLIETARGALHQADQGLEPFLAGSAAMLILPVDLAEKAPGRQLYGQALGGSETSRQPIYRLSYEPPTGPGLRIAAAGVSTPVRTHSAIHAAPATLGDLLTTFQADDFDLAVALDNAVNVWVRTPGGLDSLAVLLIQVPIAREPEGPVERHDLWAFILGDSVRQVAVALDLWSLEGGGGPVLPFGRKPPTGLDQIEVGVMNTLSDLSNRGAALMNGLAGPSGKRLAAVGAGALGSQILVNLFRAGETLDAVVDKDRMLPHNFARHAAPDYDLLGCPKTQVVQHLAGRRLPGSTPPAGLVVDASDPRGDGAADYAAALAKAEVVLDFAASVPVSRYLALDAKSAARRVSAFLSPNGCDLVVLAEDAERTVRLDHLELNYYRCAAEEEQLAGHFALPPTTRYARSCREVSAQLPQAQVAMHAGIAAATLRRLLDSPESFAAVWRLDAETQEVRRTALDRRPMRSLVLGDWTVLVGEELIARLAVVRAAHLPAETGGVLLGDFDTTRRLIYLTTTLASPADSAGSPRAYVRGAFGLAEKIRETSERTLGMLRYVGEWHSHPEGSPAAPSADDMALYGHLAHEMSVEGYPPVVMIVAGDHFGVLVDGVLAADATVLPA
jgi:hypothetical protein